MSDIAFHGFSQKIRWYTLFFMFTVVAVHSVKIWEMYYGDSNNMLSDFYLQIASQTMTFFFLMSGFWFFRKYSSSSYTDKLKKKLFSILIPYIAWGALKIISVQLWSLITAKALKYSLIECIKNMLFFNLGFIDYYPLNGPLWYLMRLMSYFIVSPVIYYLIKNKFAGAIFLSILMVVTHLFGYYTFGGWIFVFSLGGYIGLHFSNEFVHSPYKGNGIPMWFSIVIYACYNCLVQDFLEKSDMFGTNQQVIDVIIVVLMITLTNNPKGEMKHPGYAFILYCSHVILLTFITKLAHLVFNGFLFAGVEQTTVMLSCCLIVAIMYFALRKFTPGLYHVLTGGRA